MIGFKSMDDFRVAFAAGNVCGSCFRHKDEHLEVIGPKANYLLCPTIPRWKDLREEELVRRQLANSIVHDGSGIAWSKEPERMRERVYDPFAHAQALMAMDTGKPLTAEDAAKIPSASGYTVVADETVELCHARDPHSPRVCMRPKGHEGDHEVLALGGFAKTFPRDHRTDECQHGVSAICERCRGQWHVMGNRK